MDPELRNRIIAGVACLLGLVVGVNRSGAATREHAKEVDELIASMKSPEAAQAAALDRDFEYENTALHFQAELDKDLEYYGLAEIDLDTLRAPNGYGHHVTTAEPLRLAPNAKQRKGPLSIKAALDKVTYQKGGATIKAMHAVAVLQNVGDKPVAYAVDVRSSDRGECEVKATRRHNAMALMPGESAELVVCGGRGGVEVLDLQTLEITPLGYIYLSKLPPQAVGLAPERAQAHFGPRMASRCANVPTGRIANGIDGGQWGWDDVVDFYSRHNCDRIQIPDGYARSETALETLPVTAAASD